MEEELKQNVEWQPETEFLSSPRKYTRHIFSVVGLSYAVILLGTVIVQCLLALGIAKLAPQLQNADWYIVVVSFMPLYLITMPICVIVMNEIEVCPIKKHKMSFGQWFASFLMCIPIMYLGNIIGNILMNVMNLSFGKSMSNPLESLFKGNNVYFVLIATVLIAPVLEEYIFRKLLLDRIHQYGEGIAIIVSGTMFGLAHGNFYQFFYAFALGAFFAFIYIRTGKIGYTIIMHMIINFMGTAVSVFLLNSIDLDRISKIFMTADQQQLMQEVQSMLPQIMLLVIYGILLVGMIIAGIVLLIVNRDKFKLNGSQCQIPKGLGFSMVIGNPGMIIALICGIGIFVLNFVMS